MSRKGQKQPRAYKLNGSDLIEVGFMSYQQWAAAEKLQREAVMGKKKKKKKCVSISLPLHLSSDEGRDERLLQQNCLSLMNYNPLEEDAIQKTMVDHNTFTAQFLLFDQSLKTRAAWVIDMGKYEVEGVSDCLWGTTFSCEVQCKKCML